MLKVFRIFQGCFTVQLSRFFAVVLISSNFYIISLLLKFVNNFFIYFSIFRLKLCVSCCLSQTPSLYYHPFQHLSTAFFIFLQNSVTGSLAKLNSTPLWNLILQKSVLPKVEFNSSYFSFIILYTNMALPSQQ